MKTLLTGDLQFSEQPRLSRRDPSGLTTRLLDQVECFNWMLDVGREKKCDAFAVLGDLFDSRKAVPVPVLDQVGRCFDRAHKLFANVFVVAGNHDSALRVPRINSLRVLHGLAHVIDSPEVIGEFAYVPWVEDRDQFRRDVARVAKKDAARFLLSHALVEGAVPKVADATPVADLLPKRWERIFLGDVHEPVALKPNIQYVGAPLPHHFGDAGRDRGFFIFDTVSRRAEFVVNELSPKFHVVRFREQLLQLRARDFVRVEVDDVNLECELSSLASKRARWVESTSSLEDEEGVRPRIEVLTSDSAREVLERYLAYRKVEEAPGLLTFLLEVLEEAEATT